jgi:hypothetical protein
VVAPPIVPAHEHEKILIKPHGKSCLGWGGVNRQ